MRTLLAGIDGGQSSTVALIGDEHGRILSRGTAGPADEVWPHADSTRLRDALREALADACRHAGLPAQTNFAAIVAGVSGYEGRVYGANPEMPTPQFLLMHDAPIAHAGALAGRPGVVVIAGTGSVVYSRDETGRSETLGGWGFLFGDEGSAFRIAADALAVVMKAQDDGDGSLEAETKAVADFFETGPLRELVRAFYAGEVTRERLAAFTPIAMRFPRFREIANRGADRLVALACRAVRPIKPPAIALTGGLFADAAFYERVRQGIVDSVEGAQVLPAAYEPSGGALLLAYRELGLAVSELRS